jgi:hypothetical protein
MRFIGIVMELWTLRRQFGVYRGLIFLQYSVQAKFVSSSLEMLGALPPVPSLFFMA